jgi:MFS family permease
MDTLIKNKQLIYLFLCNFAILFVGFGLFPLLPLYAVEFDASPSFIGIYLAITYIAISIGSILAGQLSERLPRKTLFAAAGLLGIPSLILLGQAESLWQVVILTALVWFAGGVGLSIANVLTSLHTTPSTRGRAFGLTSLASPLGAMIGGVIVGQMVAWQGYPLMFAALAVVWTMWPLLAIWKIEDKPICIPANPKPQAVSSAHRPGTVFIFLLVTVLLASMTVSVVRLGLTMSMKAGQFSASDVSTANAIGGLVTIPLTLMIGVLSDKLGRKRFLTLGYLVAAASAMMLIAAQQLWQFWAVSSLVLVARSVITSMSPAYATDLLSRKALGRALPLVGTMNWVSGVIGFAGSGYMMDLFGAVSLYGATTLIAILAVVMVIILPANLETTQAGPVIDTKVLHREKA